MDQFFTRLSGRIAHLAGRPAIFMLALLSVIVWAVTGPISDYSQTWQLVINTGTTIITFLMVFLVQNSQNRDAAAMQAKLDELLRIVEGARSEFIGIEHLTDIEIDRIRVVLEEAAGCHHQPTHARPHVTVGRLQSRR